MNQQIIGRGTVLATLADSLSITAEQHEQVCAAYDDLGTWLKAHADSAWDVSVYSQGSVRIGTTNQDPWTGHFDADAVVRVDVPKEQTTQEGLNDLVGGWLDTYTSARQTEGHSLAPHDLEKKKRAWTLEYDRFHIDVLPVVPQNDTGNEKQDPSWLTDKELTRWQETDPRAFSTWFEGVSSDERTRRALAKAQERQVDVQDLPPLAVKTTLQHAVQLLKRHRDNVFGQDPEDVAPPSIIITALAGRAYADHGSSGQELEDVLDVIVPRMWDYVDRHAGVPWIPNPGYDKENYADRFRDRADRLGALQDWLAQAAAAFTLAPGGLDKTAAAIDKRFGNNLGQLVVKRLGEQIQGARTQQRLGSTAAGTLVVHTTRPHKEHTFFGEPTP